MQLQSIRKLAVLAGMAALALIGTGMSARAELTFNFNSNGPAVTGGQGSQIVFQGTGSGASFSQVNNNATNNFTITSTIDGTNSANGLQGNITGTFAYTTIMTSGTTQTGALTGTGMLTIINTTGTNLTATVTGVNIKTDGTSGATNTIGTINLSGVSGGTGNTDLAAFAALAAANGGIEALTFQFIPAKSLTDLTAAGTTSSTSFSGTLTTAAATPEPATIAMALTALPLFGLGAWVRRRRVRA